ncbi:restriction endonuclease subunit S, partial [Enterobacter hormaechei subsp. steigerwaltii]|uniref:restriction endonuclease subunit S n=1 Tax=Enterobacter hormaechei TaxID=158836 RepID=UPI001E62BF91
MMSLWDALRMNMMISYQELVRTFPRSHAKSAVNQASISTTDLKGFKAKLPGLGEQQKIASVLTAA